MNVLFLTYDYPYPTTSGGKARAYSLLKFASHGISVHLVSFTRGNITKEQKTALHDIGISSITTFPRRKVQDLRNLKTFIGSDSLFKHLYYNAEVSSYLKQLIREKHIDVLHCESFYTAYYLEDFAGDKTLKKIYGSENIEHKLYEKYTLERAPMILRPLFAEQAKRIHREEECMVKHSDVTLAVTKTEADYFRTLNDNVSVIENGVSLTEFPFRKRYATGIKKILFVGNFDYFPNKDAVLFFYEQVFTKLGRDDIIFSVIGKGSSQFLSLDDNRVKTAEFVKDIKDAYYDADIFICPVKIGGGTNFKILEAMATGVPVISFSDRVKEIGAKNEESVLLADDAEVFRKQVTRLLTDPALSEKLATNARRIIEEKFSWDIIGKHLRQIWMRK